MIDGPVKPGEDAGVVIDAQITEVDARWHLAKISFDGGSLWFRDNGHAIGEWVRVRVLARDVSLAVKHQQNSSIINSLPAEVLSVNQDAHAGLTLVKLKIGTEYIIARISARSANTLQILPGKKLWAQIKSVAIIQ